jgi:hypothetical protein
MLCSVLFLSLTSWTTFISKRTWFPCMMSWFLRSRTLRLVWGCKAPRFLLFLCKWKSKPCPIPADCSGLLLRRRKQWVRWDLWTVYNAWCMHAWIEFVALSDEGYRKHTQQRRHPHPKSLLRCSDVLLYACAWWQLASWTENGVLNCHLSNYSLHIYKISVLYNISVNYCEYKSWIAF